MNIALIIARSGSTRIKNKNIKIFYGKPMIYYPIKTLLKSNIFKEIYVSTDSRKIGTIAQKYKASVPFLRPKSLANNQTSTIKVIKNFIGKLKISNNVNICCVYPATPLMTVFILKKAFKKFLLKKKNFLVPIQKAKSYEENIFKLNKKKQISKLSESNNFFKDTGQFYFGNVKTFLKKKSILFSGSTQTMIISKKSALDINTIEDWKLLKKMFKNKKND